MWRRLAHGPGYYQDQKVPHWLVEVGSAATPAPALAPSETPTGVLCTSKRLYCSLVTSERFTLATGQSLPLAEGAAGALSRQRLAPLPSPPISRGWAYRSRRRRWPRSGRLTSPCSSSPSPRSTVRERMRPCGLGRITPPPCPPISSELALMQQRLFLPPRPISPRSRRNTCTHARISF